MGLLEELMRTLQEAADEGRRRAEGQSPDQDGPEADEDDAPRRDARQDAQERLRRKLEARQRQLQQIAQEEAEAQREEEDVHRTVANAPLPVSSPIEQPSAVGARALRAGMDLQRLREALVMKAILDPPPGLRRMRGPRR